MGTELKKCKLELVPNSLCKNNPAVQPLSTKGEFSTADEFSLSEKIPEVSDVHHTSSYYFCSVAVIRDLKLQSD